VTWKPRADVIAFDANTDGMFPLLTNCDNMPLADVLAKYKYQPALEKRHEQLKTVYAVAPAFLKNVGRIEALLLLYFIAMLVQALIERQVRLGMDAESLDRLPLYPEDRDCRAPTANRILDIFETLQRNELLRDGTVHQRFEPTLSDLQLQILRLLRAPDDIYPAN
jgi:transposase